MNKGTQKAWVYAQLKRGKKLTAVAAYEGCGAMRLASIIFELREAGEVIVSDKKRNGAKSWAEYSMPRGKRK